MHLGIQAGETASEGIHREVHQEDLVQDRLLRLQSELFYLSTMLMSLLQLLFFSFENL